MQFLIVVWPEDVSSRTCGINAITASSDGLLCLFYFMLPRVIQMAAFCFSFSSQGSSKFMQMRSPSSFFKLVLQKCKKYNVVASQMQIWLLLVNQLTVHHPSNLQRSLETIAHWLQGGACRVRVEKVGEGGRGLLLGCVEVGYHQVTINCFLHNQSNVCALA